MVLYCTNDSREYVLKRLAWGLFNLRKCRLLLTANSESKENKVSFGTSMPGSLSKQADKIPKGTSQSSLAKLTIKLPVAMYCIEIPAQSLYINIFSSADSVTQHH